MKLFRNIIFSMWSLLVLNTPYACAQKNVNIIETELDPSIRSGKLANGLTYYIKHIKNSSKKLNMHLYIKVGTYHEGTEEIDFAHAVEHLAFTCAKNFPVHLINDPKLQTKLGMTSYDMNAITSHLFTRYHFNVPTNNAEALDTGLLWFHDINNLQLTDDKIIKEKGPLRQEVVFRQGDDLEGFVLEKRLISKLFPCQPDFSKYFEHNKNFSPASLKEFYKKWYSPGRMAVVIVGEVTDLDSLENKIKTQFSDIEGVNSPKNWSDCRLDYLKSPDRFAVVERGPDIPDHVNGSWEMELYMRSPESNSVLNKMEDLHNDLFRRMLNKLLTHRFREMNKEYNSSALKMHGKYGNPSFPGYQLTVSGITGTEQKRLNKAIAILISAKKYGFTRQEWNRVKKQQLKSMNLADTTKTGYWMDQIEKHFVHGETLPINKAVSLHRWLSRTTLEDFNTWSRQHVLYKPNDIGVIAPTGKSYTEAEVQDWIDKALTQRPKPFKLPEVPTQLLGAHEISKLKGLGHRETDNSIKGTREFILDNGVKVVLDSTGSNENNVYFHGFTPYGASCFPMKDYFSAINAPSIVRYAGVGKLNRFELERYLAGTSLSQGVESYINYNETGIKGSATSEDLEKLLQLVHLYFTQPRKSKLAYEGWKLQEVKRYINPTYTLNDIDFGERLREFLGDSSKAPIGTKQFLGLPKIDVDSAYNIYNKLFGQPRNFTVIISGNFSIETILPLLEIYLGNIPNKSNSLPDPILKPKLRQLPIGPLYYKFSVQDLKASYKMRTVIYSMRYFAKVENLKDWKEHINVEVLGALMYSKVGGLRFDKEAALYSPSAWASLNRKPNYYDFGLKMDCEPEEFEHLKRLCKQLVLDLQRNPVSPELFQEAMKSQILPKLSNYQKSSFYRNKQLYNHEVHREPLISVSEMEEYMKSLTPGDIQKTAKKYFRDENLIEFEMWDRKGYQEET